MRKTLILRAFLCLLHFFAKNRMEKYAEKIRHRKHKKCRNAGGDEVAKNNEEKIYENLKSIEEWAFAGISQKEMAEMLGMAYSTFRDLKKKIPALSALLKKSAEFLKAEKQKEVESVEVSLLKRCLGYEAEVKKHIKVKKPMLNEYGGIIFDESGKAIMEETTEEVTESQHIPADVGAIKFYLLNKARKDWKNDPERLAIEKKRLENDTKRTELAANNASEAKEEKTVEDFLDVAEAAAEEGAENAENV